VWRYQSKSNGKRLVANEPSPCISLWDAGTLSTENGSVREIAGRLDQECSADDRTAWQAGTPTDWANESLLLTTEYLYPLPESNEISDKNVKRALPTLHKRLVQAGVRLAWLLNEVMK
jgi:hypothetical protein